MATPQKILLTEWAEAIFGKNAPHINTLRRWANEGRITPQPEKICRAWFVDPNAQYVGDQS